MLIALFAVGALPGVAWGHGMHYIGTLTATGNGTPTGTVSATTGQGVTGTEPNGSSRPGGCAGSPNSTTTGPLWLWGDAWDDGYNKTASSGTSNEPQGCVDVHTTTGSTSLNPLDPEVTISGSGFRGNTTFGVTYLFPNDPGDIDGDDEGQLPTDINDPFCHRLYFLAPSLFVRATFTTNGTGSFGPVTVQLAPYEVGGKPAGTDEQALRGQLCISSQRFDYKGPVPAETGGYIATSQGQSVPLDIDTSPPYALPN